MVLWSTVSEAAVRSRRMRRDGEPAVIRRLLVTMTSAVSVLYAGNVMPLSCDFFFFFMDYF